MLLSRYLPTLQELQAGVLSAGTAYDLARVGGWLQSNDPRVHAQQRRDVHLLLEGSVVRCSEGRPPIGHVVDVRPADGSVPHPVWRYGLALGIGVPAQEAT